MDMMYEYKDAFSLKRCKIDTCPNIEVEIDMSQISLHSSLDHITCQRGR